MSDKQDQKPQTSGFDELSRKARVDYRMVKADMEVTPEIEAALRTDLHDHRLAHVDKNGRPCSWKALAKSIGVAHSTLTEWHAGKYRGNAANVAKAVDRFLADEREKAGRFDIRAVASIGLVGRIRGTFSAAIRYNSMAAIIGPSGSGKTTIGRACAQERGGVVFIRADETRPDARGVSYLLCQAIEGLRVMMGRSHPKRMAALQAYIAKHRNLVLCVDECQYLDRAGLSSLRTLHDTSDPEGKRCLPIILFGDESFYKQLVKSRAGEQTAIAPQLSRRIYPILDISRDARDPDTGDVYSVEDIVKILRNDRLRIVSEDGVRWLTRLANLSGWGSLGFAVAVCRIAFDIAESDRSGGRKLIEPETLTTALETMLGPSVAMEVNEAAGGELLRRVG